MSAELEERQTMTAPASKDCPVCDALKLSDDCPHLWQSTISQLATHYGQTKNTLRLWVSIARHRGFAVVFVKTQAGEYLHFQANTYEEAIPYFDHTDLTVRGIIEHKRQVAYSLLKKLDAVAYKAELADNAATALKDINLNRTNLKRVISECDNILKIMSTPTVTKNMEQSDAGVQTKTRTQAGLDL